MAGIELAKRANNWSKLIFRDAQIVRVRRFDMAKITDKLPEIIDYNNINSFKLKSLSLKNFQESPCPGKFSVIGSEFQNSIVPGTVRQSWFPESLVPQIWVPVPDFSILSPGPESWIFWFCVPVPVPDLSQSRILKWVLVSVPVKHFRDRDFGIPGTLFQMPTPDLN